MTNSNLGTGIAASPRQVDFDWMSINDWFDLFNYHKKITEYESVDLLFLGDSLTENWSPEVIEQYFSGLSIANFGIGGDHTGNVLWRLQNMALDKFSPKLIVLQIGVNNIGHLNEGADVIFTGIQKVLSACLRYMPNSKILLNGVFPFEQSPQHYSREVVRNINQELKSLADNKQVFYQDYGDLMLEADGTISTKVMHDFLHPSSVGYKIWAHAMAPEIKQLLK